MIDSSKKMYLSYFYQQKGTSIIPVFDSLIIYEERQYFYSSQVCAVQPTHVNHTAYICRLYSPHLWAINLSPFKWDF